MDELELKSIWNAYDKKLEKSLQLNARFFENLQTNKARSKLNALLGIKIAGAATGILWNLFLGALIYGNHFKNFYFSISVSVLLIFGVIGIAAYIRHIVMINQINYTESITGMQQKLAALQLSTVKITGLLWLQLPFYTIFFWSNEWVTQGNTGFWLIAFPVTIVFAILAIGLYKNISPKNLDKIWVRKLLIMGVEYKYVLAASELLQEIEDFKQE